MRALSGLVACASLLAAPSFAVEWQNPCGSTRTEKTVSTGVIACSTFAAADTTFYSRAWWVDAPTMIFDVDPDTGGSAGGSLLVKLFYCPQRANADFTPDATIALECNDLGGANGNAAFDGTAGEPSTHNRWGAYWGVGAYFFQVTGACDTGDACVVTIKGNK